MTMESLMATENTAKPSVVRLSESSEEQVLLTTQDSDRFMRTQKEIVSAMRGADDFLAQAREVGEQFTAMAADVKAWCAVRPSVHSCTLCPRTDDWLALIVAKDEDPDGSLDDAISQLDLEMFSRNKFRVTWLMLRASEAGGARAFLNPREARLIYRAGSA